MGVKIGDGSGGGGLCARGLASEMELRLDLREGKGHRPRIAVEGECIDPGAAGIAETKELGNLVVGFASGVVQGAANKGVIP